MAKTVLPSDVKELNEQLRTRGLVRAVADREFRDFRENQSELIDALVTILNSAEAPPIDLHLEEALSELGGWRFFQVQHILCELIPHLNVELDVLLTFVTRLVNAGGNDLAAGAPSNAFGSWSMKDPIRPGSVYEAVSAGNELAVRQLSTILRMNTDIEQALIFAQTDRQEIKIAALSALGTMDLGTRYGDASKALLEGSRSDDEETALRALEAAYRAAAARKESASPDFNEQLSRVLGTRSPLSIHFAANFLWLHHEGLTERATDLCLAAVAYVSPDNTGTIPHIDHAAHRLVGDGHAERVVRLICEVIDRSEGRITLEAFQSTYYALQSAGSDVLGRAVVYWLLYGSTHVRKCVATEVCGVGNDSPPFSIPLSSLPADPSEQLFLCRKAVGWLFLDPLAAVVIPLAVLHNGSPLIANEVLDLIYDPLLLSYGGKLKEYLEDHANDDEPNGSRLIDLLARKTALQTAMEGIERLVELHPSETQRETERVQWNDQLERGMEQGRKKSVFEDIFSKQYILYGRSSLTPIHVGDSNTHFTEIEMKSFSISSELPLLSIVDPVGLDHMLLHFKLEYLEQK